MGFAPFSAGTSIMRPFFSATARALSEGATAS